MLRPSKVSSLPPTAPIRRGPTAAGTSCDATSPARNRELAEAEATLANARHVAEVDASALERTSVGAVNAPPDSLIWSVIVGADAAVSIGSPVAEWLDCSVMLVDVPVSDIEVALLRPGMSAKVVLEGEREARQATILLTRGSAGTLGLDDLAAVARGVPPAEVRSCCGCNRRPRTSPIARSASRPSSSSLRWMSSTCCARACASERHAPLDGPSFAELELIDR